MLSGIDPASELVISVPYATEARSDEVVVSQLDGQRLAGA